MNLLIISLVIHLFPVCCHLQSLSSESSFFALYILITFQFGADEHFSSHSAKTSQNKMILDISCIAGQIRKNAASPIRTCCVKKHIHLLLICFAVYRRDCCFFSDTNISQILSLVISKDLPICLHLFAKKGPGARLQVIPARLQASLWCSHLSRQSIRRPSPIRDPYSFFRGSVPFHRHPTVSNGGRTSTGTVA